MVWLCPPAWPGLSLVTVCFCSSVNVPAVNIPWHISLFLAAYKESKPPVSYSKAVSRWTLKWNWWFGPILSTTSALEGTVEHQQWKSVHCDSNTLTHKHSLNRWPLGSETKEEILVDNPSTYCKCFFRWRTHIYTLVHGGIPQLRSPLGADLSHLLCVHISCARWEEPLEHLVCTHCGCARLRWVHWGGAAQCPFIWLGHK